MNTKDFSGPIHFVPGLHFSCTGCGKCCRNDWDIPVTQKKAQSIRGTELFQKKSKDGFIPLKMIDDSLVLGRRPTGGCVFLADDELCELHRDLGGDSKPLSCQIFPLNLVKTPDGLHVSLSFACPAVLAGVGLPLEETRDWVASFVEVDDDIPPLTMTSDPVSLSANCEISYSDYLELESRLLDCLDDSLCPQGLVNWACGLLESGPELENFSPLRVSSLLSEALGLLDVFGRAVVGIVELPDSHDEREDYMQALATDYAVRSNRLGIPLPSFAYYRSSSKMTRDVVLKFVRSQIAGKRLLTGPSVVSRLLAFGTGLTVLCYYIEAQARKTGTLHFSFQQMESAFTLVEENILTHSDDLEPYFDSYEEALTRMIGLS
jgi:Fe-S-cluster containining protein